MPHTAHDEDPRCDFCERRFIRIKNGVAVCAEHLKNVRDDRGSPLPVPHRRLVCHAVEDESPQGVTYQEAILDGADPMEGFYE